MRVGRKIYYDVLDGTPILDTGEWDNAIKEKTVDEDIASYFILSKRNRDSFEVLKLEYGQYKQDFLECRGYMVDPKTKKLKFSYPDPTDSTSELVFQVPLTEQIAEVKAENESLKNRISDVEMTLTEILFS